MTANATALGRHVEINGASLYVEEYGQGDPLVLVHFGLGSSATWAGVVALLAEQFRIIIFDNRGHGRSTNPAGILSYEQLTDDTAALIDALELERPFVGGWSDGGQVTLEFGMRHPGRAHGLLVGGATLTLGSEAARAEIRAFFHIGEDGTVDLDAFASDIEETLLPMLRQWHPLGEEHWRSVMQQSATMWLTYAGLTREQVERIDVPALVVLGDRDEQIPVEEALRIYRWLPNTELAILPGSDHLRPIFDPPGLVHVMTDFLRRH